MLLKKVVFLLSDRVAAQLFQMGDVQLLEMGGVQLLLVGAV